jgi:hypothetical protein
MSELLRLSCLADAHSGDQLRNPSNLAHRELIEIVQRLARQLPFEPRFSERRNDKTASCQGCRMAGPPARTPV